jgi:hypothetical protein
MMLKIFKSNNSIPPTSYLPLCSLARCALLCHLGFCCTLPHPEVSYMNTSLWILDVNNTHLACSEKNLHHDCQVYTFYLVCHFIQTTPCLLSLFNHIIAIKSTSKIISYFSLSTLLPLSRHFLFFCLTGSYNNLLNNWFLFSAAVSFLDVI